MKKILVIVTVALATTFCACTNSSTSTNSNEDTLTAEAADAIYGGTVTTHNDIWVRRGTTTEWKAENPVLGPGEIVYDETAHAIKVGNGESAFTDLQYIGYTWDVDGEWDFGNINQGIDPPGPDDEIYDFGNINLIEN